MTTVWYLLFLSVAMAVSWWLTSYDTQVTGENERADIIRRAVRCGITLVLLILGLFGGFLIIPIAVILGIIWASCGAEFFSRQFHKLIDPEDKRDFDPKETERRLDQLARFIRDGHSHEALALCQQLEESRDASPLMLEATFFRLYQEILASITKSGALAEICRLREGKQFGPAESQLKELLVRQPENWAATLLMMRMYAQDLSQAHKAIALLQPPGKPSPLPHVFVKYARRSIDKWSGAAKIRANELQMGLRSSQGRVATAPSPKEVAAEKSIDEMLKGGQLATAIELLEKALTEQPQDFDLWLKLAEAHAVYCADPGRAAKIIRRMENSSKFTEQAMELARAHLKDWRAPRRS